MTNPHHQYHHNHDTQDQAFDPAIKVALVKELREKHSITSLEINKRKDALAIKFALADLYNHGFLYTEIKRTPEHLIATTDKQLYRIYITTQKFWDYLERGDKIE